jgi:Na+/H+ antiporter NhaD/arsenite permease-like protein
MHGIVRSRRQRMLVGTAIVLAANCGGCFTVIGDPTGLLLWGDGAVTATNFSKYLALPAIVAWVVPTLLINRQLPERLDTEWQATPYRGDDTNLKVWQRLVMLIVGIGGLWFIPSFRAITHLSPFLGALCVLSVLWIVNEVMNRKLMNADQMIQRRTPRVLQYGVMQLMLYVMGIILAVGVVQETGAIGWLTRQLTVYIDNTWLMGTLAALISCVLDNFATSVTFFSMHETQQVVSALGENHLFWKVIANSSAMGGNVLLLGSVSGLALIKMERMHVWWFFRHVGWTVIVAWMLGMGAMAVI